MHLLVRRYNRSGYAASWFYAAIGVGFGALAILALAHQDWLAASAAIAMVPITIAGARLMRRLKGAARASRAALASKEQDQ